MSYITAKFRVEDPHSPHSFRDALVAVVVRSIIYCILDDLVLQDVFSVCTFQVQTVKRTLFSQRTEGFPNASYISPSISSSIPPRTSRNIQSPSLHQVATCIPDLGNLVDRIAHKPVLGCRNHLAHSLMISLVWNHL